VSKSRRNEITSLGSPSDPPLEDDFVGTRSDAFTQIRARASGVAAAPVSGCAPGSPGLRFDVERIANLAAAFA